MESLSIVGGGLYTAVSFSLIDSLLSSSNSSSWGMFTEMGSLLTLSLYITLRFLSFGSSYVSLSLSFIMEMSLFLNASLGGCFLKHVGHLLGTLFLSGRIPQISVQWGLAGEVAAAFIAIYVGLF